MLALNETWISSKNQKNMLWAICLSNKQGEKKWCSRHTYTLSKADKNINAHMPKDLQSYLKDKNAGYTHTQLTWTQCHGFSTAHDERFVSLSPGTVITLGGVHKFRFNHPAEAAVLRERRRVGADRPKTNVMLLIRMTIMKIFMMSRWLGDTLEC